MFVAVAMATTISSEVNNDNQNSAEAVETSPISMDCASTSSIITSTESSQHTSTSTHIAANSLMLPSTSTSDQRPGSDDWLVDCLTLPTAVVSKSNKQRQTDR